MNENKMSGHDSVELEKLGIRLPPEGKEDTSDDGSQHNTSLIPAVSKATRNLGKLNLFTTKEKALISKYKGIAMNSPPDALSELSQLPSDDLERFLVYLLCKRQEKTKTGTSKLKEESQLVKLCVAKSHLHLELLLPFRAEFCEEMEQDVNGPSSDSDEEVTIIESPVIQPRFSDFFLSLGVGIHKVFKGTDSGRTKGDRRIYIIIAENGLHFYPKDDTDGTNIQSILYDDIQSVLVGLFDQWLIITRKCDGNMLQVDIGDPFVVRQIISNLEWCGRRWTESLKPKRCLVWRNLFEKMHTEICLLEITLRRANVIDDRTSVIRTWFVLRENGEVFEKLKENSFCLEGHFMLKIPGLFAKWRPCYFILTEKLLYEFTCMSDSEPKRTIPTEEIICCDELLPSTRPHCFQITLRNGRVMQLGAPDHSSQLQWRQKLNHIVTRKPFSQGDRYLNPSQLVLTTSGLILLDELGAELMGKLINHEPITPKLRSPKKFVRHLSIPNCTKFQCTSKDYPETCSSSVSSFNIPRASTPLSTKTTKNTSRSSTLDSVAVNSSVFLDQISVMNICDLCPAACVIELECTEALVIVHDWVLHFRTEQELSSFLHLTLKRYRDITYKDESLIREISPNLQHLLVEGYAMASDFWDFC